MGFSLSHLLVVLAIIAVVFGTKRLRNIGTDLGGAIKDFQVAIKNGDEDIHVTEHESQTVKSKMTTETENS